MSFTAEVKDELSRVEGSCPSCDLAHLSALVRVCGTLSFGGSGHYAIRVSTETGAVARTVIKLAHEIFGLDTPLTVRRSVLHKTRNYLIEMPAQPGLDEALVSMGILGADRRLAPGVPHELLQKPCCRTAYLRGAFMAGGFIADPRGDFHMEVAVMGETLADDIADLVADVGPCARINRRRGSFVVYLKSFDDVVSVLRAMGGTLSAMAVTKVHDMKSRKNEVNRLVNAEIANQGRSVDAAAEQLDLIAQASELIGLDNLPPTVREFCRLRSAYPELSLRDLGRVHVPPISKSALYHRMLRLRELVEQAQDEAR